MDNPNLDQPVTELAHVDYLQLFESETVGESIQRLRQSELGDRIAYFYATNKKDQLRGVVPARRLLMADPGTNIGEVMVGPVVTIPDTCTLRDALQMLATKKLLAIPIVDEQNRLNGVIDLTHYTNEAVDLERREAAENMFQLLGVHIENERAGGIWASFRSRFPWLLCNVASGLAAAAITSAFHKVLETAVALAFFFPLVLGIAESVSMVAVTLGLQLIHGGGRGTLRELRMGPVLGLAAGLVVGAVGWIWLRSAVIGTVLVAAVMMGATFGAGAGLLLPRLVHRWKLDPKIASGPAVLAITDVATLACYLGLATAALR